MIFGLLGYTRKEQAVVVKRLKPQQHTLRDKTANPTCMAKIQCSPYTRDWSRRYNPLIIREHPC